MKKKKKLHGHVQSIRSSEMMGLSTSGETVGLTGPVSSGHTVILMDSAEEGQLSNTFVDSWNCVGSSIRHTNVTVLVPFPCSLLPFSFWCPLAICIEKCWSRVLGAVLGFLEKL